MSHLPDKEILKLIRDKETENYGFNLLIRKYQEKVYWPIRRIVIDHEDANDVIQQVFIKAWRNIDKFREDSSLYTWIYRIATNESLGFLKKKRNLFFIPLHDVEQELRSSLEDDHFFRGDEIQKKLHKAILTLPEKQRIVFNMKYFDELKYEEMTEIMGTSVGALKASYHLAVKKIEKYIKTN